MYKQVILMIQIVSYDERDKTWLIIGCLCYTAENNLVLSHSTYVRTRMAHGKDSEDGL